jgi:RHS repeat-associated protein
VSGATNLTNPKIIDHVSQITDISGRKLTFTYTDKGLLGELIDGAGSTKGAPKTFKFAYDMTQGNKNVKLVKVTDPRGKPTSLAYYDPPGDDPKFHWWAKNITDRIGGLTSFAYTDPDAQQGSEIHTVVTDAENHAGTYRMDGFGRPYQLTNAKQQVTKLAWDADNNVTRLEEHNGAFRSWRFDPKTGYPLEIKDAEANKNGTPGTVLTYQTGLNGRLAELTDKTSPEGRRWNFGYDLKGNLSTVTDPAGTATTTAGDFTVRYEYDGAGLLSKATDANGNATSYAEYDPVGMPRKIIDPLQNVTTQVYDSRGNVTEVIDAKLKKTTQSYDIFGRMLERRIPKDQDKGEFIVAPAPEYDANDNVTKSTAPNGAVTTRTYDAADQITSGKAPPDTTTGPERKATYTYDKVGNLLAETDPKGNLTADPDDFTTRYTYDEIYQRTSVTNAELGKLTMAYDDVGNVSTIVDPRKTATPDPDDVTSRATYDLNHQVKTETDAAGHTVTHEYDRDGKKVAVTDKDGSRTIFTLDARALVTEAKVPHSESAGTINYRVTRYVYDQAGNRTKEITPRGVETTGDDEDFVKQTGYDKLNRVAEEIYPYDPGDSRHNRPEKVTYTYDQVGNQTEVSAPPSEGQTVRNVTKTDYFDNGWVRSSTDPWDIATKYDYNAIGQQTNRTLESAGGSSNRVITTDYYPDGKLKSKTDDGVPVGKHVALADDSDFNNAGSIGGTWTSSSTGTGFQGFGYATHPAGTGTTSWIWNLVIPQDGDYEVFVKYPAVSGATANASYQVDHADGTATKTVDQRTGGGEWVSVGSFAFDEGNTHRISLSDQASGGTVLADAVKLVRDTSGDPPDTEKKTFSYEYDVSGNQTKVTDSSSGALVRTYDLAYNELNQITSVVEKTPGGAVRNTTSFSFDENGNLTRRAHDNLTSTFEYDQRDLLATIRNATSAGDTDPKTTSFTYTAREEVLKETKGNGNTVDYDYFLDGLLRHQIEKQQDGTVVGEYTASYNANGNQTSNATKVMNADDHAATLDNTYEFSYDPRDRITKVDKSGDTSATETYIHDANDNIIEQSVADVRTTYKYDRNRLLTATAEGGATSTYNYDPFGRLDTVTQAGQIIEKRVYDGFDRTVEHRAGSGASAKTTKFVHDPMDRTVSRTKDAGGDDEKTTTYNFLGTSDNTVSEEVDGSLARTYYWAAGGAPLSQLTHKDGGAREHAFYGFNPRGDVTYLPDAAGDTKATYGYTAYGSDDEEQFTGVDKPDPANPDKEPYNTYRYSAKKLDEATGDYDMGARDYDPDLNRFLTRDMYNGALDDLSLVSDPFTGNRYAFAGGNPITNIELDGHLFGLSLSDIGHAALDVVGLIPVVGEVADVANGIWYAAEGNYVDAALSFSSAIPLAGYAATAAKGVRYGMRGAEALNRVDNAAEAVDTANDIRRNADNLQPPGRPRPDGAGGNGPSPPSGSSSPSGTTPSGGTTPTAPTRAEPPKQPAPAARADTPHAGPSCPVSSFTPDTKVMMADGSTKAIKDVKVGDQVLAAHPDGGGNRAWPVIGLKSSKGTKHLVKISVDADAGRPGDTGSVTATGTHPFWIAGIGWTEARDIRPGMWLRTSAGTYVQVSAVKAVGRQAQRVHNLSVDGPSTYYVAAGWLNLLVHNSGCVTLKLKYGADWTDEMKKAADDKVAALNKAAAEGKLVTTKPPKRLGRNNQRYTNETGETVDSSEFDIDHIIDLQLGGADAVSNMNPLFRSVNRSLGPQIAARIKGLPLGTPITRILIE